MFLKGKELWGYIDGSFKAPKDAKDLKAWEMKRALIISRIMRSMKTHIVNNLRSFTFAKEMWEYLKCIIIKTIMLKDFS